MAVSFPKKRILEQLPKNVSLNFVNLFKTEIIDRFSFDGKYWHLFDELLSPSEVDSYIEKRGNDPESAASEFYEALLGSEKNEILYLRLLDYFKEVDNELYAIFSIDEWEKESFHLFGRFLNAMDALMPHFDLQKVVEYLSKYSFALRREYGQVLERWKSGEISENYAKSLIIRTICIMYDSSTYHLMYAILKCSDEARYAIEKLFPEFEMFYIRNIFEDRDGIFHIVDQYDNLKDAIDRIMDPDIESPYAVNVLFDYIPKYHIAPLFHRVTKNPPLNLRGYQYELAEPAINGKNTVICAPTGSGKTIVAIYVIRDHIIQMRKNGRNPKVAFIVPTGPLVDQQKNMIDTYLSSMMKSKDFRGATTEYLNLTTLKEADVFVMTAKMLVNAANPDEHDPEDSDFVPLKKFTLLVLDEAHHTGKKHPFNELMDIFRHEKYGNGVTAVQRMPQVVSMTASLGTSKTKNIEEIKNHMIGICANMDAETISRTVNHLDELKAHTSNTDDEIVYIPANDEIAGFRRHLMELVKYLENAIRKIEGISGINEKILFENHCEISLISYIGWVTNCAENILPKIPLSSESLKNARFCLKILEIVFWTLKCATVFPAHETAKFYLEGLGDSEGTVNEKKVFEVISEILKLEIENCAIFEKLIEIINFQLKKEPNSRIIIFMAQKNYCKIGSEVISKYCNKEVSYITGSNSTKNEGGQTINEQKEVLKNFKSGKTQILCGTTVADEGLDIEKCNLVIKYDLVTDEIAHVQRKGRAREIESKCFLLTSDSKLAEKEKLNKYLVEFMEIAHDEFSKMTEHDVTELIQKNIKKVNLTRIEEWKKKKALKEKLAPKYADYDIYCKDCNACITGSECIRLFHGHYVVADPDIWKKVDVIELDEREKEYCKKGAGLLGTMDERISPEERYSMEEEAIEGDDEQEMEDERNESDGYRSNSPIDYVGLAKTMAADVEEYIESDSDDEEVSNYGEFAELTAELNSSSDSDSATTEEESESTACDKIEKLSPEGVKMVEKIIEKNSKNLDFKDSESFWKYISDLFNEWKSGKINYEIYYGKIVETFTWAEKWLSDYDSISYRRQVESNLTKEKPLFPSKKFLDSFYRTYSNHKNIKHEVVNPKLLPQIDRLSPKKRGTIKDYVVVRGDIVGVKSRKTCLLTFAQISNIYVDENTKEYASLIWLKKKNEERSKNSTKTGLSDGTLFDPENYERAYCDEQLHPLENLTFECHRPKILEFQDEPTIRKFVFKQYRQVIRKHIRFLNSKRRRDMEARRPEEELTRMPRRPSKFWIERREAFTRNKSGFLVVKQVLRAGRQTKDSIV